MKLIYIAGPYTAETTEGIMANIDRAIQAGSALLLNGYVPVIPHVLSTPMRRYVKGWRYQDWMDKFCLPLLEKCDAIFLMENWQSSKGAIMEKDYAKSHEIPVIKNIQELVTLC